MIRFNRHNERYTVKERIFIHGELAHGVYVDEYGDMYWYKDGYLQRDNDKPAIVRSDGTKAWFRNNVLHRDNNQPAVIRPNGKKEWWIY